jgi:hypothetical protein
MSSPWTPLVALGGTLLPLLWVKRWITRHLQELSLRWVGDPDVALVVYFVVVLPGVVLHELSHWLVAKLLGVRVSKLSLGPVRKGRSRRVSLGSVRVGKVDPLRAALIGLAPLLGATAVILLIGNLALGAEELAAAVAAGGVDEVLAGLESLMQVPDFWLWLYLIFSISNAMLPSESDMSAVWPVLIFLGIATFLFLIVAGVPSLPPEALDLARGAAGHLASAFGLTLAVDAVFGILIGLLVALTRRAQRAY